MGSRLSWKSNKSAINHVPLVATLTDFHWPFKTMFTRAHRCAIPVSHTCMRYGYCVPVRTCKHNCNVDVCDTCMRYRYACKHHLTHPCLIYTSIVTKCRITQLSYPLAYHNRINEHVTNTRFELLTRAVGNHARTSTKENNYDMDPESGLRILDPDYFQNCPRICLHLR